MTGLDAETIARTYRAALLEDTIPFWLAHGTDPAHGGVLTGLGRDGAVIDTDKSVWAQGRCAWMLATLYNTVEPRQEWLEAALSCLAFLDAHAYDRDGRMFFLLTRDGRPLRKRRYAYSEAFASMGFAAVARATGRDDLAARARESFEAFLGRCFTPGAIPPKVDAEIRPLKGLGPLMIAINVAQVLRDTVGLDADDRMIDGWVQEIERDFLKPELRALMETVGPGGELIDHFDGRTLNPGHAVEAAWFILHEARHRGGDPRLLQLGTTILDWTWDRGWDPEHGGLLYFCDVHGGPVQEYWHDMKFWWPHTEAIIATFLAHAVTGEERFADRFELVHDWAHRHFPDPAHGEWFGYLHRDGSVSVDLKGNHWKGPFHLPRMQWYCSTLILGEGAPASPRSPNEG